MKNILFLLVSGSCFSWAFSDVVLEDNVARRYYVAYMQTPTMLRVKECLLKPPAHLPRNCRGDVIDSIDFEDYRPRFWNEILAEYAGNNTKPQLSDITRSISEYSAALERGEVKDEAEVKKKLALQIHIQERLLLARDVIAARQSEEMLLIQDKDSVEVLKRVFLGGVALRISSEVVWSEKDRACENFGRDWQPSYRNFTSSERWVVLGRRDKVTLWGNEQTQASYRVVCRNSAKGYDPRTFDFSPAALKAKQRSAAAYRMSVCEFMGNSHEEEIIYTPRKSAIVELNTHGAQAFWQPIESSEGNMLSELRHPVACERKQ